MAQQQIITKPYVEVLQDNDSLFINHDGALRQIKKSDADFASGADMRAEVTARETFEAQEVAAREAFEKSETEARKQFETSVGGQIAEKANVDGYYEEMTVGDAEQLVATQFVEDNEPYLFRSTGGSSDVGNRAYFDKIVGGTVAWNQLVVPLNRSVDGVTMVSNGDGSLTLNGTSPSNASAWLGFTSTSGSIVGHKYLVDKGTDSNDIYSTNDGKGINTGLTKRAVVGSSTESKLFYIAVQPNTTLDNLVIKPQIFDLTQMFGTTIADYIYSLEQSQAGAGVAWFKKLFPNDYYPYNAGELLSVEGLQSHDAVGFNQWDEEWEILDGHLRTKNYNPCIGGANYFLKGPTVSPQLFANGFGWYDANKELIETNYYYNNVIVTAPTNARYFRFDLGANYGTTYNHDICINLSNPSRNGEYEPYEKHSYPLDSSLTLRGIPKLDASNNLYYDGDEYTSDGKVKRKYTEPIVLNGSEQWLVYSSPTSQVNQFYTPITGVISNGSQVCVASTRYTPISINDRAGNYGTCYTYADGVAFNIDPNVIATQADWVAHLQANPITVVCLLATPTTETAEPFQFTQIIDDFGTEEFVSNGFIPAGHVTRYPANLRDKLQHLPDLAGMDGTYLIQQSGKQMSLVYMPAVFPETPTEDGTYMLKTVVTGGVATLQWVAE